MKNNNNFVIWNHITSKLNKKDTYFGNLAFYSDIDNKYKHCNMNISTYLDNEKSSFLKKLYG